MCHSAVASFLTQITAVPLSPAHTRVFWNAAIVSPVRSPHSCASINEQVTVRAVALPHGHKNAGIRKGIGL